jgi:hypothetical protein
MLSSDEVRTIPILFALTDADGWHAGIGDPTVVGWITVLAYFVGAFLTFRAGKISDGTQERKQRLFWYSLTAILVLLGINKQLDLQTLLTVEFRKLAIYEGIYEKRRTLQGIFILIVALTGIAGFNWMWRLVHTKDSAIRLGLAGLFFLVVFIFIRAASFHHIDAFLKYDIGGFRMNWVLELGGIALVSLAALKACRRKGKFSGTGPSGEPRFCPS